jgi:general secretion pathway protein G
MELLAVLAIMAVLASVATPLAELTHKRSKEQDLRAALREIRAALDRYKALSDQGVIPRAADGSGYPPTLDSLTEGVADGRTAGQTKIYLLRRLPRDPFARSDQPAKETWGTRSYASPSDDPRPGKDVFDVSSRSDQIALDGSRYQDW